MSLTKNFDELHSNDKPEKTSSEHKIYERYKTSYGARYVCFIEPDGTRHTYAYIDLRRMRLSADESTIKLSFLSEDVLLTGHNLLGLFDEFFQNLPMRVFIVDERYNTIYDDRPWIVMKFQTT